MPLSFRLCPLVVHFIQLYNGGLLEIIEIYSYRTHYGVSTLSMANRRKIYLSPRPGPVFTHDLGQKRFRFLRHFGWNIRRIKHKRE